MRLCNGCVHLLHNKKAPCKQGFRPDPLRKTDGYKRPATCRQKASTVKRAKSAAERLAICDRLWSEAVRLRDLSCVACGALRGLHAHHYAVTRAHGFKYRHTLKNGVTLCSQCHQRAHSGEMPDSYLLFCVEKANIAREKEALAIRADSEIVQITAEELAFRKNALTDYIKKLSKEG